MESFSITLAMERELLGSFIYHHETYSAHAHHVNPNCFSKNTHQNLLYAIRELVEENVVPDVFTLKHHLTQQHDMDSTACLTDLPETKLNDAQIKKYLHCITNEYVRVQMLRAVLDVSALCENELTDLKPALTVMDHTVQLAENIHSHYVCSPLSEVLQQVKHDITSGLAHQASLPWFSRPLQSQLHGLENGELTVVASRPGIGKTAFALTQVYHLIRQGIPVIYVSTEHTRAQLAFRLLSMHSNTSVYERYKVAVAENNQAELRQLIDEAAHWPIDLIEDSGMRIQKLIRICLQRQAITQARFIVFDTIQQLRPGTRDAIRDLQLGEIMMQLKRLAKSLNIPVLALSQLNRSPEKRGVSAYPILSDLRESGYIETIADKVMLLYRAEYYGITEDEEGQSTCDVADLIVAKNRNGKMCNVRLHLSRPALRFDDMPEPSFSLADYVVDSPQQTLKETPYETYDRDIPQSRWNELNDEH
ncbi:MAG: replicative DNA helicase [Bacteroidota bacterium]